MMLFNAKTIKTVSYTSGSVTWFFPIQFSAILYNPFSTKLFKNPFCSIIPSGGFHFMGLRVTWFQGQEIKSKRIVK